MNFITFDFYAAVIILAVSFAHFLILSKYVLLRLLFLFFFVCRLRLEYLSSDGSDKSDEEESEELGSKFGSADTFGDVFVRLFHGVGLTLGVTLYSDESCDGDGGSLVL